MTTDYKKCLEIICDFPTIYKTGDKTPIDILKQSGYADLFEHLTEDIIIKYIDNNAGLVDTWINYTEDIRHSPAWGLQTSDKTTWTVFFMDNGKMKKELTFDNSAEACAKMIKMTMEELRNGLQ